MRKGFIGTAAKVVIYVYAVSSQDIFVYLVPKLGWETEKM